ncbi:TPA: DUF2785 domain-containing protein [Streptococcus suis]|uniref:DUF2785 domain-containing protein n=1 Tax=Streptococcus suis TaxID=1307 RepID=UPI00209B53C3|nr:DUF2785 domain-containing protein [Streptococcus suis]MCO8201167.1 DUF2785 domain-containing protein [Streptococcus suis]MCO8218704.1 DUF2785 domain-containing protein [Streptococcus suis]HEM3468772.1 DUF2785 domain-containing protein [Streptococcus suis]HEM3479485.1 DUF2785 domain-containing protein [Streptococcus suis]
MKELIEKLQTSKPYTDDELAWLLENIGHPDPTIRDELVYASFCHIFLNGLITREQAQSLLQFSQETNPLSLESSTLKRSFTCLLYCLLLSVDNDSESIYHAFLNEENCELLFQQALNYLTIEDDWSGYDEKLGWIHTAAHGADFLLATSWHEQFPNEKSKEVCQAILTCLTKQSKVFSAGEEIRLAQIPVYLLLNEKVSSQELAEWINKLDFPNQEPLDYFRWLNLQHFLSSLYFQLKSHQVLTEELRQAIEGKIETA